MAELHHIECIEKSSLSVTLKVYIIHADESEFYEKKNYALQLLWYNSVSKPETVNELRNTITPDNFFDTTWVNKHCSEYIESVKIIEVRHYPVPENLSFNNAMEHFMELPMALFFITVTSPLWIAHIECHSIWKSAAYEYGGE